jgi:hypothetical protein
MEVDQRKPLLHGKTKAAVVAVIGIRPTVSIPEEAIGGERVVVRPVRCGGDGQWCLKNGWLEDALWPEEPNPVALQLEALGKGVSRKHVAVGCDHAF